MHRVVEQQGPERPFTPEPMGKNAQLLHNNTLHPNCAHHARSRGCGHDTAKNPKCLKVLPNRLDVPLVPAMAGLGLVLPLPTGTRPDIHHSIHIPVEETDHTPHSNRLPRVVEVPKAAIGPAARTRVVPSLPPAAEMKHDRCEVHSAKTR